MDIISYTIANPVKVAVSVLLVCLFGLLALFQIPIQLTPNVDEPRVTVTTRWPGKNVREVEREIVFRQEEKLKGVPGLRKLTSVAREGRGEVMLEFFVGTDKDVALRETDEKLNQVSNYPIDVEKPEVVASDASLETPIAWLMLYSTNGEDVTTLRDFAWDDIKPILERVEGLSYVDVVGGREREVHVLIDPALLAARGLTLGNVETALRSENVNVSAGSIEQGKREFLYRTVGEFEELPQIDNTVIAYRQGGPIYVRDVGRAVMTYEKQRGFVRSKGRNVLGMPVRRESGSNVMKVMAGLKQQIDKVNKEILNPRGLGLELTQVYDETVYIDSAIQLVKDNFIYGGALAIIVLMLFLRNWRATAVVAVSIPISMIGTFLFVGMLGRTMNVIMLAGMAFAIGMVVDNAVVVLENIYRHRQLGKPARQAAYEGAKEVWGAVLNVTLTTMVVFIPVIFIQEEAGQLFRDISIAISAGVGISLIVSVLVIPVLSARVLAGGVIPAYQEEKGGRFSSWVADLVDWFNKSWLRQAVLIFVFAFGSIWGSYWLMPPTDYLPSGNRNLVFGMVMTEPGLGVDEFKSIAVDVENYLRPYWEAQLGSPEAAALPTVQVPLGGKSKFAAKPETVEVRPAPIDHFFFGMRGNGCFLGVTSKDPLNVKPLQVVLENAVRSARRAVGASVFTNQAALFGSGRGGNSVDVEIRGNDLDKVYAAAMLLKEECEKVWPYMVQPDPSNFDLLRPEVRAIPDRVRAADIGLTVRDIGFVVEAAVDGALVGFFREHGDEIDLVVKLIGQDGADVADIKQVPIYTETGRIVPLSSVVDFREVGSPQQINHVEQMPAVTLKIRPPPGVALQTIMDTVEYELVNGLRTDGRLDPSIFISLAGHADKLVQTRQAMFGKWTGLNWDSLISLISSRGFLAVLVTYLLMAGLFESFIHPLSIMLTVPLSVIGGFAGLKIVHSLSLQNPLVPVQQLDVVTMLGFVILVGVVVDNGILIVHQALNNISYGMTPERAIHQSVQTRLRPIFMTALTTVVGQIPLAIMPGAGSELYRGLAAVNVGGLLVATAFTLVLIPVVFSISLQYRARLLVWLGREDALVRASRHMSYSEPAVEPIDEPLVVEESVK